MSNPSPDLKRAMDIAKHGLPPRKAVTTPPPRAEESGPALAPPADGDFDADTELYRADGIPCAPYTMLRGQQVWVFPCSSEESGWLSRKVVAEIYALGLVKEGLTGLEATRQGQLIQAETIARGRVWQVIACVRKGPTLDAPKAFEARHAEALRCNPGWLKAVQDIANLSDSLNQGKTEADLLREVLADFFGGMGNWLGIWSSALTKSSSPTSFPLSALESCVSSLKQPELLSAADLPALLAALPLPKADADHD